MEALKSSLIFATVLSLVMLVIAYASQYYGCTFPLDKMKITLGATTAIATAVHFAVTYMA